MKTDSVDNGFHNGISPCGLGSSCIVVRLSVYLCGRSYEQAGLICKENKELSEAADLMEQAAFMFQENGTPDTAALTLEKAAKSVTLSLYVKQGPIPQGNF